MKVVIVSHRNKNPLNLRINAGFYSELENLCDEFYMVDAYDKKEGIIHDAKFLYDMYKPDVMICHAHNKILEKYFQGVSCLKVMIAVDFTKLIRNNRLSFYSDNEFDLVIQRGFYDENLFKEKVGIPSVWLPFSASDKEFYPDDDIKRKNMVLFAGTCSSVYTQRKKAIEKLSKNNLLDNKKRIRNGYPKALRSYVGALTSAQIKSPHGKSFEIMASRTTLLSPSVGNQDLLFEKNCFVEYEHNCSNVVQCAKKIINEPEYAKMIAENGYRVFKERHTDDIRIRELYDNLKNMLEGRKLVKKWGI